MQVTPLASDKKIVKQGKNKTSGLEGVHFMWGPLNTCLTVELFSWIHHTRLLAFIS